MSLRAVATVLTVVALVLVPATAAGATWERSGYDPGRTGAIPFEGPQTNDTAFMVELPGMPTEEILLVDQAVYVLTRDGTFFEGDSEDLDDAALWRIELPTGEVSKVLDLPDDVYPQKVTPELVIYENGEDLVALERPSGQERWSTRILANDSDVAVRQYTGVVQVDETLYIGFSALEHPTTSSPTGCIACPNIGGVAAFDLDSEQLQWSWKRTSGPVPEADRHASDQLNDPQSGGTLDLQELAIESIRLSADDQRVYGYTEVDRDYGDKQRRQFEVWAIEDGEGTLLGNDTEQERTDVFTPTGNRQLGHWTRYSCCAYPVVSETSVNIRLDAFEALNKVDGASVWPNPTPAGRTDQIEIQGATSLGVREDVYIGTSPQTVYRLDALTGALEWMQTDSVPGRTYGTSPTVLDATTAYVPEFLNLTGFSAPGIEARDLETGSQVWSWSYRPSVGFAPDDGQTNFVPSEPAFGPGIAVWGAKDGTVHVIGETEASLGEPKVPEQMYPGVANETTLNASSAEPGAFGNATRYMVDWGDGTLSGWQSDPIFSHTYNESGEFEAQVYAGNDANQTSSTFVTMNVGKEAPTEPNWIEERFHKENQDLTFGILGLAVALGGGAIGIARRKRKQSILQEELETLEEGFERTRDNPGECEAFLDTRKARAQSLLLDGDLDEEQFGVLERRIDELHGELRTSVLDARFEFLPHGMVQSLKKMLADGRISTWEREAIETLLEDEETLSRAQKEKVRSQLERWFAEDAGSEAP